MNSKGKFHFSNANSELIFAQKLVSTEEEMRKMISLDLEKVCKNELEFLQMVQQKEEILYEEEIIRNAIRRYEKCWLPLKAICPPDLSIFPPLDVHLVWHAHLLSPTNYRADCLAILGKLIDHEYPNEEEMGKCRELSISCWNAFCPEEPFDFPPDGAPKHFHLQKCVYDLANAIQRQRKFASKIIPIWQSTPNPEQFLADSIGQYFKFLQLAQTYPAFILAPSADLDLVWHAHQTNPLAYNRDCLAIFGHLLKHNDAVGEEELKEGAKISEKLWKHHFGKGPFKWETADCLSCSDCLTCGDCVSDCIGN